MIPTLTLAIPVHNDAEGLARILALLDGLTPVVAHVVVVDDGSDPPLEAVPWPVPVTWLRNDSARGPGAARNMALEHVTTPHVMFLDADDTPTPELVPLMRDLAGQRFDFCLFQHHDSRAGQELRWGQMRWDRTLWSQAGVLAGALSPVGPEAAGLLARTANYPWNKIYRTAFLRDHGIHCTPILVHEDVELHWRGFLHARRVFASDRVGVVHHVAGQGRLTDRRGPERLEVFPVLARLAAEIGPGPLALPFARFAVGLCDWIAGNLREDCQPDLAARVRKFVDRDLTGNLRRALEAEDPELVERIKGLLRA